MYMLLLNCEIEWVLAPGSPLPEPRAGSMEPCTLHHWTMQARILLVSDMRKHGEARPPVQRVLLYPREACFPLCFMASSRLRNVEWIILNYFVSSFTSYMIDSHLFRKVKRFKDYESVVSKDEIDDSIKE